MIFMTCSILQLFQSTLPRRERRFMTVIYGLYTRDFNPRSREGSDINDAGDWKAKYEISIHAPAKGATNSTTNITNNKTISIHAPAKGATSWLRLKLRLLHGFQSTLPRRERLGKFSHL